MSRARDRSGVSVAAARAPAAAARRRADSFCNESMHGGQGRVISHSDCWRLLKTRVVAVAFLLLAAGAAVQRVALGPSVEQGRVYTHYNNYVIFRDAFTHLRHGQDLYSLYPDEHWDLYKYSPTFAALMAPFAPLPDAVGLVLGNVIGVGLSFRGSRGCRSAPSEPAWPWPGSSRCRCCSRPELAEQRARRGPRAAGRGVARARAGARRAGDRAGLLRQGLRRPGDCVRSYTRRA